MSTPVFTEVQQFRQRWIWIPLMVLFGVIFPAAIFESVTKDAKNNADLVAVILLPLIFGSVGLLFYHAKLTTNIDEKGVRFTMSPFNFGPSNFSWDKIDKAYVRTYNAALEFGGWGVRLGWPGKGKAYTFGGNRGLQLELKNGKKVLIGSHKPDELERVLKHWI